MKIKEKILQIHRKFDEWFENWINQSDSFYYAVERYEDQRGLSFNEAKERAKSLKRDFIQKYGKIAMWNRELNKALTDYTMEASALCFVAPMNRSVSENANKVLEKFVEETYQKYPILKKHGIKLTHYVL